MANASFALGMVASIADKLTAMKVGRDKANYGSGRALVVLKAALVDAEFARLDLNLRMQRGTSRMVSTLAYEAGGAAGASLAFNPGIRETRQTSPASENPNPQSRSSKSRVSTRL